MGDPSNQAKSIFLVAIEQYAPEQWPGFLDEACADDAPLRGRVEQLLRARSKLGSFHEDSASELQEAIGQPLAECPGTVIGPYKLMEQIGEGGMGLVFVAEQQQPVRRSVALKVIKPGMDTRQVIARFEAERQALALMDHPNIARVLDAGATASDRPYFVMELVKGVPITDHCNQNQFTPRERLELFVHVCHAVQHAHQKGIIHRDLKPSNVLVTSHDGTPVVKVIDFGVAKAIGQQLTEKSVYTQLSQMVGTPLYMSPEQAGQNGLDADTRSDIYSLGVLLYELLTGTTPFDKERFKQAAYDEIRRIIREEEPPKPSTRLSKSKDSLPSISAQRHTEPAKLTKLVRGELDWIVMKALEKDRNRRYETANGFAMDVQRYLADEPVAACPPSAWYRFRKFARRNKAGLAIAGMILFFFVLLGGGIGWVARDREAREQEVAREQAARLAATQRLAKDGLQLADRHLRQGNWPEANATAKRVDGLLESVGNDEQLQQRLWEVLKDLNMIARLEEIRLQQAEVKEDHFDNRGAAPAYAQAFRDYGIDVETLSASEAAACIQARSIRVQLAAALDDWARVGETKRRAGKFAVARAADSDPARNRLRDALERGDRKALAELADAYLLKPELPPPTLIFLAGDLIQTGAVEKGAALLRKAQQRHPDDFWINHNLAYCLAVQMRPPRTDEAIRFYTAASALRPKSPGVQLNLGSALVSKGNLDEAIGVFRQAIDLKPDYAVAYNNLGIALWRQGKFGEAIPAYQEAIRLKPDNARTYNNLGNALRGQKDLPAAIDAYKKAVGIDPQDAKAWHNLGNALRDQGQVEEAIAAYRQELLLREALVAKFPNRSDHQSNAVCTLHNLVNTLFKQGNKAEARLLLDKAIANQGAAVRIDPKNVTHRLLLRNLYWLSADISGFKHDELAKVAEEFPRILPDEQDEYVRAAWYLCACVTLAQKDDKLPEVKRTQLAQRYAERAVEMLRQSIAKGNKDANRLKTDPAFAPLRSREDFQKLVADFEAKNK